MTDNSRSTKALTCPKCGAQGHAELHTGHGAGSAVSVISVTKEFRSVESKTAGTAPGFICQHCGTLMH